MKNIYLLIMIMGFAAISACASDEVMETAESDASEKAEMMKQEQSAAMEAKKAAAAEAKAKADAKARADAAAKKAAMEEEADDAVEQAEETSDAMQSTGDLVSTCEHSGKVRVIKVVYDNPETETVCEVTYEKSTGVQTLWTAINDRDFCLDKAKAFVEKQEGWGWSCSALE